MLCQSCTLFVHLHLHIFRFTHTVKEVSLSDEKILRESPKPQIDIWNRPFSITREL